jgi:hypothetical protein
MARNVSPQVAAAHPLRLQAAAPSSRRRNLVFIRCGDRSVHRLLYPLPATRNWDCALSLYQPPRKDDFAQADYVLTGGLSKWDAFAQCRFERPDYGFAEYAFVLLADDDVLFRDPGDIDRLFEIAGKFQLAACQPSLSHESHGYWLVTRHHPSWYLRFTNFVECMAPVLSAEAILLLEEDLRAAVSGCGLDLVFHHVLGEERRMAVVDAVSVTHTQAVDSRNGPFYRFLHSIGVDHEEEIAWFLQRHGLTGLPVTSLGGVPLAQNMFPLSGG